MRRSAFIGISVLLFFTTSCYCSSVRHLKKLDQIVDKTVEISLVCLKNSVCEVENRTLYPSYGTKYLKWKTTTSDTWTSGFYPGCLWLAYELSKEEIFKKWAEEWTVGIEKEKHSPTIQDFGLMFSSSFGNGLRLAPGDTATTRYKEILLTTASTINNRFDPKISAIWSFWDTKPLPNTDYLPVIIDCMMNLQLIFWASQNGGDATMMDHCILHANTTYRDFIREDGSSYHIVRYDRNTGKILNKGTLQGDIASSTWSRGHAWMIYGLTTTYRYTHDPKYLTEAMQVADYFIKHLPKDLIANWDLQSQYNCRDVSASAVVTSALFEMLRYIKDTKLQKYYLNKAEEMLKSLCLSSYFSFGKGTNCLLLHATQNFPSKYNIDVPSSLADYYFLESIVRYKAIRAQENKN